MGVFVCVLLCAGSSAAIMVEVNNRDDGTPSTVVILWPILFAFVDLPILHLRFY